MRQYVWLLLIVFRDIGVHCVLSISICLNSALLLELMMSHDVSWVIHFIKHSFLIAVSNSKLSGYEPDSEIRDTFLSNNTQYTASVYNILYYWVYRWSQPPRCLSSLMLWASSDCIVKQLYSTDERSTISLCPESFPISRSRPYQ